MPFIGSPTNTLSYVVRNHLFIKIDVGVMSLALKEWVVHAKGLGNPFILELSKSGILLD
jgi:hypothetical protein